MLGFKHEHTRRDRDKYVRVYENNIKPLELRQFRKCETNGVRCDGPGKYDYKSIMHYPNKASSINGKNTIEKINDPNYPLGSERPSTKDINTINSFYRCRGTTGTSFKYS